MGYGTRDSYQGVDGIRTFEPDDTEDSFFIADSASLSDIINQAFAKWGNDLDFDKLIIEPQYIHTDCLGYDRYDPGDYTNYLCIIFTK